MSKFESIIKSNPFLFSEIEKEEGSRQIYIINNHKRVYFQSCKISEANTMWNAIPWEVFNSIDYYCLKIEDRGFMFMPVSILRYFATLFPLNNARFDLHFIIGDGKIEFVTPRGHANIDIREYYHSL